MKIDWTTAKIDFMEKFSAEVKRQRDLQSVLEDYEDHYSCDNCAFLAICGLEQNLTCYDTLKIVYEEYCEKFDKEITTEKTKEKMLIFIELDGKIKETLRVTANQYKVIKHLAECNYFDKAVKIHIEEMLEYNLTDFT